ncbi:MAG: PLP-dependent aminotransferase family protein [Rhodocyclaceae bacterium]|nr:PLP-dependent aminotransferase family protein [Rhodocyclaceae bacterium]
MKTVSASRDDAPPPILYQRLAERVADTITAGTLRPGERLLSVRQACDAYQLSPITVLQAYYLLEARGLIEARPRSGYYVRARIGSRLPEPEMSRPPVSSTELDVSDFIFDILESVRDPDVAPLGSSFPSPYLFPLDRLARSLAAAARRLDPRSTVTDLPPGNEELRRQIALRYLADGADVPPAEIVVTSGAMEGINLCLQAACKPGDIVAIESPCFYGGLQAIERLGLKVVEIPTHPRDGISLPALEAAIAQHPVKACLCMLNFQNPLGSTVPDEARRALIALLARHGIPLIEDDVYAELYFDAKRPLPSKSLDAEGLVMHVSSFAKCLAPGYRVGWVAAGRFAEKIRRLKLSSSIATNVPAQAALADFMKRGGYERHLRHLRATLAAQEAAVVAEIERAFPTGTRLARPRGGYFVWLELPPGADALAIHRQALAQGVSVAPGPIFSAQREFRNCLRINTGHPWSPQIAGALGTLAWLAGR